MAKQNQHENSQLGWNAFGYQMEESRVVKGPNYYCTKKLKIVLNDFKIHNVIRIKRLGTF